MNVVLKKLQKLKNWTINAESKKVRRWTNKIGHKQYEYELDKLERKLNKCEKRYEVD